MIADRPTETEGKDCRLPRLDSELMNPQTFADLVRSWLTAAEHPGIAKVQTCMEIGRWEQPAGVKVTLDDGWAILVQMVGASPLSGHVGPLPPELYVRWEDREDYGAARAVDEQAAAKVKAPPRGSKPGMRAGKVLTVIEDVVKRADHPQITSIRIATPALYPKSRPNVKAVFADGSDVVGWVAGIMLPGSTGFAHPAHEIPEEWS